MVVWTTTQNFPYAFRARKSSENWILEVDENRHAKEDTDVYDS